MEAVEHVAHVDFILVGEYFPTIEILVSAYLVVGQQLHDYPEQVKLSVDGFFGEIQRSVLVLFEVELAIYYAHPRPVGVGNRSTVGIIELLHALCYLRAILLLLLPAAVRGSAACDSAVVLGCKRRSGHKHGHGSE